MKTKHAEFTLVEKKNHFAIHGLFGQNREVADKFLAETVPLYCAWGYYMDKTLTPQSFEIVYK